MNEPNVDPQVDYPLGVHRKDLLFTPTGKSVDEITIEAVVSGKVTAEDLRITPDTLRLQAQISEKVGRVQLGANLRRAAEMTAISDARVLEIYNALRPNSRRLPPNWRPAIRPKTLPRSCGKPLTFMSGAISWLQANRRSDNEDICCKEV